MVIPLYNEAVGVKKCADTVSAALEKLDQPNILIMVDDGSGDATPDILREMSLGSEKLVIVSHEQNRGYGCALQTGALEAEARGYEYVVFMDSDLTNDPGYLASFTNKMSERYDLIKASRYMRGGGVADVPWWRVAVSRAGNAIAGYLFDVPIHDCTNGFRAIRTSVFRQMIFTENKFAIIMEELYQAKLMGCRMIEVPNILSNRTDEQRPTSFSYKPSTFYRYLKYPLMTWLGIVPKIYEIVALKHGETK